MTRFDALGELFDDALELPAPGADGKERVYRIPSPPSLDGVKIQRIADVATRLAAGGEAIDTELLNDAEERDLLGLCLGPVDAQLQADGVSSAWRRLMGLTAFFWITTDTKTAQTYWATGGDPSQAAPNRAARRTKAKKSGSAAASKTRSRGSSSGTSAPRATASARKAAKT